MALRIKRLKGQGTEGTVFTAAENDNLDKATLVDQQLGFERVSGNLKINDGGTIKDAIKDIQGNAKTSTNATEHIAKTSNPHSVTMAQIALPIIATDSVSTSTAYSITNANIPAPVSGLQLNVIPTITSAANPTLSINGGTAYPIYVSSPLQSMTQVTTHMQADRLHEMVFDGDNNRWIIYHSPNSTYSELNANNLALGTETTDRSVSSQLMNTAGSMIGQSFLSCSDTSGTTDKVVTGFRGGVSNAGVTTAINRTAAQMKGLGLRVLFEEGNSASNPTLAINSGRAIPLKLYDNTIGTNTIVEFICDGANWVEKSRFSLSSADGIADWAKASTKPTYIASEIGLGNVDNVKQYSASNPQVNITGNAGTADVATKLATARTISLTGAVTGSVTFDGSANRSITTTIETDFKINGKALENFSKYDKFKAKLGMNILPNPDVLPGYASMDGGGLCADFNNDGTRLAVASGGSPYITIYDTTTVPFSKLANPTTLPSGAVYGCNYTPDGTKLIVAVGGSAQRQVIIYNATTSPYSVLDDITTPSVPLGCTVNHDGTKLVVQLAASPFIAIYDISVSPCIKLANPTALPAGYGYFCAFNHNGTRLALSMKTAPYISIYNTTTTPYTKLANPDTLPSSTHQCAFSPDGNRLAIVGGSPFVIIYNTQVTPYQKIADLDIMPIATVTGCAFAKNSKMLALLRAAQGVCMIYDTSTTPYTYISSIATYSDTSGYGLAINNDGTKIACLNISSAPYVRVVSNDLEMAKSDGYYDDNYTHHGYAINEVAEGNTADFALTLIKK